MIKNLIIDAGHGGIDAQGRYTTAPYKMHTFSNGEVAYEGVYNRKIAKYLYILCKYTTNIKPFFTVHPSDPTDVPLSKRIEFANTFDAYDTLFYSLHSNASPKHNARGFELFTSRGETRSDKIAECVGNKIIKHFKKDQLVFRKDFSDGDLDKEANFKVLRETKCSAILAENLFFDQYDDFQKLKSPAFQIRVAWATMAGILEFNKK